MRALSAAVLVAATSIACTEVPQSPIAESGRPSFQITDGAHGGGNPFFYFLPPMVSNPGDGVNVSGLSPEVRICAANNFTCSQLVARFTTDPTSTTTQAGSSETIRESDNGYIVNWHTTAFDLVPGAIYRICSWAGLVALGHADIAVVGSGKDLKDVNTGEYISLLDDRTLPIKFRIQSGATDQTPDPGCSSQPE
jgi:hypothetical protein